MQLPRMGQPQFGFPRMEPFQHGIGQPETGFKVEPPQRCGPIRNEPYRLQFRFKQPYKFRNEPPRNEPYRPPQNRRTKTTIGREMTMMVRTEMPIISLRERHLIEG